MGSRGSLRLGGPGVGSLGYLRLGGPGVGSLGSLRLGGPGVGSLESQVRGPWGGESGVSGSGALGWGVWGLSG